MINVHVDVDNLWMYEKEFGIKIHKDKEYIYSKSLPLFLKLLRKTQSKATFMIIGQDLLLPACREFCKNAASAGHEIANHTWSHPISFESLSFEDKEEQIIKTHEEILKVTGIAPVGFRGPGYYLDQDVISVLKNLNYKYDSSILPGFAQLLMGSYAFLKGGKIRHKSFGRKQDIFGKSQPYLVKESRSGQKLWELPISTLPFVRLPMHTTFAYYFGERYQTLILSYLKRKPKYMLYLFHAIDFVDIDKQQNNHPVIPLRYSFDERMSFIQSVLDTLVKTNGRRLKTSRDSIVL